MKIISLNYFFYFTNLKNIFVILVFCFSQEGEAPTAAPLNPRSVILALKFDSVLCNFTLN